MVSQNRWLVHLCLFDYRKMCCAFIASERGDLASVPSFTGDPVWSASGQFGPPCIALGCGRRLHQPVVRNTFPCNTDAISGVSPALDLD
jgi:hypothetical protein